MNLLTNVIRYNYKNGFIEIYLSSQKLIIKNTGSDEPLDERIFERFYHGNETRQQYGIGLGLAIVERICKLYGYTIYYKFEDQMHCFTISFGAAKDLKKNLLTNPS